MDSSQVTLTIDSSPEMRAGCHASLVIAQTDRGETRLDFVNVDPTDGEPVDNLHGVLSARVYLNSQDLVALKDMLVRHVASWESDNHNGD